MAGRTVVVIAHRLATVSRPIRRVLDRDRILERGCHHELLAAGGRSAGASSSTWMREIPRSGGVDPRQPISRAASTAAREER